MLDAFFCVLLHAQEYIIVRGMFNAARGERASGGNWFKSSMRSSISSNKHEQLCSYGFLLQDITAYLIAEGE